MLSLLLLAAPALAAPIFSEEEYQMAFRNWTAKYERSYEVADFFDRFEAFKWNVDFVTRHNLGGFSYSVDLNQFADMRNEEFVKVYLGYVPKKAGNINTDLLLENVTGKIPAEVDWVSKGAVTPIKNQGQCGSCWSFSTTGSLEGSNFLVHGRLESFSEQQLVDCAGSYGNQGCNGGLMDDAFKYVKAEGLCLESAYPYTAQDGTCKASQCSKAVHLKSYEDVPSKSLDGLAAAVAKQPVSVAVDAAGSGWQLYRGGIYSGGWFGCGTSLDHGVLAVGYGTQSGKGYWKVKNSWGATWGESGYIRLKKTSGTGSGTCGIALQASYPTVA